jgi:hypothetical protein
VNRAPENDNYEYYSGQAADTVYVWIGRNFEGDLERDQHKVCIARKPKQQTQSLCYLDGSNPMWSAVSSIEVAGDSKPQFPGRIDSKFNPKLKLLQAEEYGEL